MTIEGMPPTDERVAAQLKLAEDATEKGHVALIKWWSEVNDPAWQATGIKTVSVGTIAKIDDIAIYLDVGPGEPRPIEKARIMSMRFVGEPEHVTEAMLKQYAEEV